MLWFGRSWLLAGVKRCKSLSLWRSWAFILTLNFYLGNLCNKESKSRNGCWRLQLCVPSLDDDMHVWKFKLTLGYMKTGHGSRGKKFVEWGGCDKHPCLVRRFVHLPAFIYRWRVILSLDSHRDRPSDLHLLHLYDKRTLMGTKMSIIPRRPRGRTEISKVFGTFWGRSF